MSNPETISEKSKISISFKDLIYLVLLAGSILAGHFEVQSKTNENSVRIEVLQNDFNRERIANDQLRKDVVEVKSLLMEIKGFLKKE